MKTFRDSIS